MATRGMSPSRWFRGIRVWSDGRAVFCGTAGTVGMVIWRRQRPSWITRGMLVPEGTFVEGEPPVGWRSAVVTRGSPEGGAHRRRRRRPSSEGRERAVGDVDQRVGQGVGAPKAGVGIRRREHLPAEVVVPPWALDLLQAEVGAGTCLHGAPAPALVGDAARAARCGQRAVGGHTE